MKQIYNGIVCVLWLVVELIKVMISAIADILDKMVETDKGTMILVLIDLFFLMLLCYLNFKG